MSKVAENLDDAHEYQVGEEDEAARLDRRADSRKIFRVHAKITILGQGVLPGHTVDLSRKGASITLPFELAPGQDCQIELELQACGVTGVFQIPAQVRYCVRYGGSQFRAGLRFGETDAATTALIASILQSQ
jgi:PilZ domain-containing protein